MAKWQAAGSPDQFPEPNHVLVWTGSVCAIFPNLTRAKSAITSRTRDEVFRHNFKVYEWAGSEWVEIYSMARGEVRLKHELWQGRAPKGKLAVSEADEAATLASIMSSFKTTD